MTRWRDPLVLVGIMTVAATILVAVIPEWTKTEQDGSKPADETEQFGNPKMVEKQDQQSTSLCDDSYPDFCIGPDVDCSNVLYRNFTVKEPDPYEFDRDGDGRGCEE